jgi:hypothetical protein
MELRMLFYETAVWIHEDFSNWFWRSPVEHRSDEQVRNRNAPVIYESGGHRFVIEKADEEWAAGMKAAMEKEQNNK